MVQEADRGIVFDSRDHSQLAIWGSTPRMNERTDGVETCSSTTGIDQAVGEVWRRTLQMDQEEA